MIRLDTPIKGAPFAVIDCESTGYAGPDAHVVEVAVVHGNFGSDDVRVAFTSRVRPHVAIPESATRVHGITDADVAGAPTWAEVADQVAAALAGRLPIGYGAPADYRFVAVEQERLGRPPLPAPWAELRWLDLLVVRKATKTRGRPGKLVEVAAEYGIALDAHGATGDALSTALLVRPLMRAAWEREVFADPRGADGVRAWDSKGWPAPAAIGHLLAWQREAALHQERDFAAYLQRVGALQPPQSPHHDLEGVPAPAWDTGPKSSPCPSCGAATLRTVGQGGALVTVNAADRSAHACAS